MSYINKVKYGGTTLSERVEVLSTVSGGTFTGVLYSPILNTESNDHFKKCYVRLNNFMKDVDLLDEGLTKLKSKNWHKYKTKNLIIAFSEVYYEKLINDKIDVLWELFYTDEYRNNKRN